MVSFIITSKGKNYLGINKGSEGLVHAKLQIIDKRNWRKHKQIERYPLFIYWKTILLKSLHYPNWSTDSILFIAKFQWHFSKKKNPRHGW